MILQLTVNDLMRIKQDMGEGTKLSLLTNLSGDYVTGDNKELVAQKVYAGEEMTDEAKKVFERINKAVKVKRNIILSSVGQMQQSLYVDKEDNEVSVSLVNGTYVIKDPVDMEKNLMMLTDVFGMSEVTVSDMYYELSDRAAIVLAGIMDLRIQQGLAALMDDQEVPPLTQAALADYFQKGIKNNRIAPLVFGLAEVEDFVVADADLKKSLSELADKACIQVSEGEISVAEHIVSLVDNLLVFNGLVRTETYLQGEEGIFGEKSLLVYGSPTAILFIGKGSDGIRMASITGKDMMEAML